MDRKSRALSNLRLGRPAWHAVGALLLSLTLLQALAGSAAAQSFDLCDQSDRQRFYSAIQKSYVGGASPALAGPGETVTVNGTGFRAPLLADD